MPKTLKAFRAILQSTEFRTGERKIARYSKPTRVVTPLSNEDIKAAKAARLAQTAAHKEKLRQLYADPAYRKAHAERMAKVNSPEHRKASAERLAKRNADPEARKAQSDRMKRLRDKDETNTNE
jgi:hypothetical protein